MLLREAINEVPQSLRASMTVNELATTLTKMQVKADIQAAYRAMNAALHALVKRKKAAGYCYKGLSCMLPLSRTGKCRVHDNPKRKVRKLENYITEYGRMRLKEIEAERDRKAREKRGKGRGRAA